MSTHDEYVIVDERSFIYGDTYIKVRLILSGGVKTGNVQVRNLRSSLQCVVFTPYVFKELVSKLKRINSGNAYHDETRIIRGGTSATEVLTLTMQAEKGQLEEEGGPSKSHVSVKCISYDDKSNSCRFSDTNMYRVYHFWDTIVFDNYTVQGLCDADFFLNTWLNDHTK